MARVTMEDTLNACPHCARLLSVACEGIYQLSGTRLGGGDTPVEFLVATAIALHERVKELSKQNGLGKGEGMFDPDGWENRQEDEVDPEEKAFLDLRNEKNRLYRRLIDEEAEKIKLQNALREFRNSRGRHEGEHVFCCTSGRCLKCEESYVAAEAKLDALIPNANCPF